MLSLLTHILLNTEFLYMTIERYGPLFSTYIFARYLPHVSIFVLVCVPDGCLRPKHVVYV